MKLLSEKNRMLRSMGYLSDQEGIINRYLAEREGWDSHLQKTRNFITAFMNERPASSVAVFGSGWLLDLPLEKMAQQFNRILLLDIHHPAQIREKVSRFKNIDLQEVDISGGVIEFSWETVHKNIPLSIEKLEFHTPSLLFDPDCYISLNILNQLDIIPGDYLRKNLRITDEQLIPFRKKIQQFHLNWITSKPGCLISDITEINTDSGEKETKSPLIFATLPSGTKTEEWEWSFDSRGKYREGMNTRMGVKAIEW